MGVNNDGRAVEFGNIFQERMNKYPLDVSIAMATVLTNIRNGCSWGFIHKDDECVAENKKMLMSSKEISLIPVANGYILFYDFNKAVEILNKECVGMIEGFTKNSLEKAIEHRQVSLERLQKFFQKKERGIIGIYNLNDSPTITIKSTTYSAFAVTFEDLMSACSEYGYGVKLGGRLRTPGEVIKRKSVVFARLVLAPSKNSLLIEIGPLR